MSTVQSREWLMGGALGAVVLTAMLAGCGGGGGGGDVISTPDPVPTTSAPSPTPTASPSPTPTATVTPAAVFQTSEYNRSDGPEIHNVLPLWQRGITGAGSTIAIIDTGIDTDSPEFAGRISSASASVAGNGTYEAEDQHGTNVAMVAAAARDSTGIVGIAYNATIQALRADAPGSCATKSSTDKDSGCNFNDSAIAAGIDAAIAARARVINLSLGGDPPNAALRAAVGRAAAAGIVVVVAAGNEGETTDPTKDPNNPDPFATGVRQSGNGNVLIVGSIKDDGTFSAFSNRAGTSQQWFIDAQGERICCAYENGVMKVTTDSSGTRFVTLISGTSFAAPQVSGAVALLAQAFPNLTATQIVDLLLRTARDGGTSGIDATYGRGILDIGTAFSAQGTTTLAGSSAQVPLGDTTVVTSAAMGDAAAQTGPMGVVILDGYARAYAYDIASAVRTAARAPRLAPALSSAARSINLSAKGTQLAFSIDGRRHAMPTALSLSDHQAQQARVLAASVISRVSEKDRIALGYRQGAASLNDALNGHPATPFLIAGSPVGDIGTQGFDRTALAWSHRLGDWSLTAAAEHQRLSPGTERSAFTDRAVSRSEAAQSLGLALARDFGKLDGALGLSLLNEDRTVLGARFHQGFGARGATTAFVDASGGWQPADNWRLGLAWRQGWTTATRDGSIAGGTLVSNGFSADLTRYGLFQPHDMIGLRVSQPLRVANGAVRLNLPVEYDYASQAATFAEQRLSLAPAGREIDAEIAWRGQLLGGGALFSAYLRRQPYNFVSAPTDKGVAVSWSRGF